MTKQLSPGRRTSLSLAILALLVLVIGMMVMTQSGGGAPAGAQTVDEASGCEAPRYSGSSGTSGHALAVPVTLDQLTDRSDLVLEGRIQSFQSCVINGNIYTFVSIVPAQTLKERLSRPLGAAQAVTIAVPGGFWGDYQQGVGVSPEFTVDEQVFAFLQEDLGFGLMMTEGFQGKLAISPAGQAAGYSAADVRGKIRMATQGDLSLADDPLASQDGLIESEYKCLTSCGTAPRIAAGSLPLAVFINASSGKPAQLTAGAVTAAAQGAFNAWENIPQSSIAFQNLASTSRVSGADGCPSFDGKFDTTWGIVSGSHSASTLAVTYTCFGSGIIKDADVEIDNDAAHFRPDWTTSPASCGSGLDLQTVLLHEYGHVIGLGHPPGSSTGCPNPCPVMAGTYGGVQHSPCTDDRNGAAFLYPDPSYTPTPTPSPTPTPTPSPTPTPTPSPTPAFLSGDVDCNGAANLLDALIIMQAVAGLPNAGACLSKADVNCDGVVNLLDVLAIQKYVAGVPQSLPQGCAPIGT